MTSEFRTTLAENIARNKYMQDKTDSWAGLAKMVVDDVVRSIPNHDRYMADYIEDAISTFKFLPGGRYLYYSGRDASFYNNCFLLRGEEDTREEWAELAKRATSCLMSGGGIGVDYSEFRASGSSLSRTGGIASGPIPLMKMINEIGRNVMQGGSRRSAIYASLNWEHDDVSDFLIAKNWGDVPIHDSFTVKDAKERDFNYPAPLDMTNISLNYDDDFLEEWTYGHLPSTFITNVRQALSTGEPGFSFNFGYKERETLRNACCEVVSEDDSDVCNLGSLNYARIGSLAELCRLTECATYFLLCGTITADLPYDKVRQVREKNRRLGLGIMGLHEWLLQRGYSYEVVPELEQWLAVYEAYSDQAAVEYAHDLGVNAPIAIRAIAPTGTIGMVAGTTTGIEPLYATAYKRRYLKGQEWHYEYAVDHIAKTLIDDQGIDPDKIETALDMASSPEKRIKFQYDVQKYVDQAISSTINLPAWGSDQNNEDTVEPFANILATYAHGLRGFTCYPDGARGGQPLEVMDYYEAIRHQGTVFKEHDICDISGKGGTCGV